MDSQQNEHVSAPSTSTNGEAAESNSQASDYFVDAVLSQIDPAVLEKLTEHQRTALSRFEKTNEMLIHCLSLSGSRLENAKRELAWYTQMIVDMKKDLDSIFRRIRNYKQSFAQLYPEAFAACNVVHIVPDDHGEQAPVITAGRVRFASTDEPPAGVVGRVSAESKSRSKSTSDVDSFVGMDQQRQRDYQNRGYQSRAEAFPDNAGRHGDGGRRRAGLLLTPPTPVSASSSGVPHFFPQQPAGLPYAQRQDYTAIASTDCAPSGPPAFAQAWQQPPPPTEPFLQNTPYDFQQQPMGFSYPQSQDVRGAAPGFAFPGPMPANLSIPSLHTASQLFDCSHAPLREESILSQQQPAAMGSCATTTPKVIVGLPDGRRFRLRCTSTGGALSMSDLTTAVSAYVAGLIVIGLTYTDSAGIETPLLPNNGLIAPPDDGWRLDETYSVLCPKEFTESDFSRDAAVGFLSAFDMRSGASSRMSSAAGSSGMSTPLSPQSNFKSANGLLLCKSIEHALDNHRLCFHMSNGRIVCKLFDKRLWFTSLYAYALKHCYGVSQKKQRRSSGFSQELKDLESAKDLLTRKTFGQLDGEPLAFVNSNEPYKRCLSVSALLNVTVALEEGWLTPEECPFGDYSSPVAKRRLEYWLPESKHRHSATTGQRTASATISGGGSPIFKRLPWGHPSRRNDTVFDPQRGYVSSLNPTQPGSSVVNVVSSMQGHSDDTLLPLASSTVATSVISVHSGPQLSHSYDYQHASVPVPFPPPVHQAPPPLPPNAMQQQADTPFRWQGSYPRQN